MDLMRGGSDAYEDYQVQSGGYQMFDRAYLEFAIIYLCNCFLCYFVFMQF